MRVFVFQMGGSFTFKRGAAPHGGGIGLGGGGGAEKNCKMGVGAPTCPLPNMGIPVKL